MHQRQGLEGNLGQQLGKDPGDCLGEQGPQAGGSHQSHQNWKILTLKTLREREREILYIYIYILNVYDYIILYTYDINGTPGYFSTTSVFGHDV